MIYFLIFHLIAGLALAALIYLARGSRGSIQLPTNTVRNQLVDKYIKNPD